MPAPSPTPRSAADIVSQAVASYSAGRPALEEATELFVRLVRELLDDAGINYLSVTGRTKSVASFAAKADRREDGRLLHPDPLLDITDQIGVRVITFVPDDVTAVAKLFAEELAVIDDRDMGQKSARAGRFGYASRHLLVAVNASRTIPAAYASLRRRSASVQIRTVLQHAWAEFEHDIRYKGTVPDEHAHDLDRRFTLAAGLLELADREFSAIRDRLQQALPERPADPDERDGLNPRIDAQDLAKFLAGTYADAGWSRRPLHVGLGPAARARHHLRRGARRGHRPHRRRRPHRADGLQVPARRGAAPRRRPARDVRRHLRQPHGQRPPTHLARGSPAEAPELTCPSCRSGGGEFVRMVWRDSPRECLRPHRTSTKETTMADTYPYLIREGDWNSDAYLPGAPEPDEKADDMNGGFPAHGVFATAVAAMGARILGGEALQDSKYGGVVKPGAGDRKVEDAVYTDGPFTDTAEIVSGFYLVEVDDEATARRIAALVPTASTVEWRKVFPMS